MGLGLHVCASLPGPRTQLPYCCFKFLANLCLFQPYSGVPGFLYISGRGFWHETSVLLDMWAKIFDVKINTITQIHPLRSSAVKFIVPTVDFSWACFQKITFVCFSSIGCCYLNVILYRYHHSTKLYHQFVAFCIVMSRCGNK